MKVTSVTATDTKTAATIDMSDVLEGLNKSQQREVLDQVGELLVMQVLEYVADQKSPVDGSPFKELSEEYAAKKKAETGSDAPNLDLSGDMLNALDYKVKGTDLEIGVYGDEAPKADGHSNLSGKSKLPERAFIPNKGELFDDQILNIINDAIELYKADALELNEDILQMINSSDRLYDYLSSEFDGMSKSKIKEMILSSELATTLDKYDLLELL